jgi:hypothetical protein
LILSLAATALLSVLNILRRDQERAEENEAKTLADRAEALRQERERDIVSRLALQQTISTLNSELAITAQHVEAARRPNARAIGAKLADLKSGWLRFCSELYATNPASLRKALRDAEAAVAAAMEKIRRGRL